jgi:hypothetical protein
VETQSEYTEAEAAQKLGMSVGELRTLVRRYILDDCDAVPALYASDVAILCFLSGVTQRDMFADPPL